MATPSKTPLSPREKLAWAAENALDESARAIASKLAKSKGGRFVHLTNVKSDGSVREWNVRSLGRDSMDVPQDSSVAHLPHLLTVWEHNEEQYRNLNLETLTGAKIDGETL